MLFKEFLNGKHSGYFDEAALPSYAHSNRLMAWFFWKRVETALRLAENLEGCSVLDFGAGGGITLNYLRKRRCQITACEKEFSHLTREVAKHFKVQVEVFEDLFTIKEKTFDRIFALDVLEHIDNPGPYIDKLIELCKTEGKIILSGPTESLLYKIGRKMAGFSGHYHVRNIFDIEETFRRKGLQRVQVKKLYPIFTLFRISAWEKQKNGSQENERCP